MATIRHTFEKIRRKSGSAIVEPMITALGKGRIDDDFETNEVRPEIHENQYQVARREWDARLVEIRKAIDDSGDSDTRQASVAAAQGTDPRQSFKDYLKAFGRSYWVFACVDAISDAISAVPFYAYKEKSQAGGVIKFERQPDSKAISVLKKPNALGSRYSLFESLVTHSETCGNAYWELVRENNADPKSPIKGVWPVRPDYLLVLIHPTKGIVGYVYDNGMGSVKILKPHQILHFKYFASNDDVYGTSPMATLEDLITTDLYADYFNKRFFERGARIDIALTTPRMLSDKAATRLQGDFESMHQGYRKTWRVPVLQGDIKIETIQSTHQDMEFMEQKEIIRKAICATFRVPASILGYPDSSPDLEQSRQQFYSETIVPKLIRIEDDLNSRFVPLFGEDTIFKFDIGNIRALQDKEMDRSRVEAVRSQNGIWTVNEIREQHNLPPVPWGNEWFIPKGRMSFHDQKANPEDTKDDMGGENELNPNRNTRVGPDPSGTDRYGE